MAMGETGMGNMMEMGRPKNTLPMMTVDGPFGPVEMGGMFTILKVGRHHDLQRPRLVQASATVPSEESRRTKLSGHPKRQRLSEVADWQSAARDVLRLVE